MTLKRRAVIGSVWTGLSSIAGVIIYLGQVLILARILTPEEFGLAAMVMVVVGFAQLYADAGVSNAIIHRQDSSPAALASLYWLNIGIGFALYLVLVIVAPVVAKGFGDPRVGSLLPLAGLMVLVVSVGQQFRALLERELRFRPLAVIEILANLCGAGVAIFLAVAGYGVLALIYGYLCNAVLRAGALFWIGCREWPPRRHFAYSDLRDYLSFGLYQMAEKGVNFLNQRLDQLLLGATLGALSLGYYNLAFSLAIFPVSRINSVLTRVAFPVFAKVQDDNVRLRRGYMTVQRIVSLINFPILMGIAVLAPILVPLFLGDQWVPAIPLLQILAFVGMLRATGNPTGSLLLARGRAKRAFHWNLGLAIAQVPVVLIGAHLGGSVGVALAVLLAQVGYFGANYVVNIRSTVGPCLREHLHSFLPASVCSVLAGVMVLGLVRIVPAQTYANLALLAMAGFVLYATLIFLFFRRSGLQLVDLARGSSR